MWGSEGEIATFTVTWAFRDWNHTDPGHGWWADSDTNATGGKFNEGHFLESERERQ